MPSELYERFYALIEEVPAGSVAGYAHVARAAGLRNGARLVGWALRRMPEDRKIPWQRIVASDGRVSIVNMEHPASEQAALLEAEGTPTHLADGWIRVTRPRWYDFQ
jgi:methylated-DNA-protein-cysteine methyltransferase-like protein